MVSWNFRQVTEYYLAYFYAYGLPMSSVWLYGKNTSFFHGYYGTRHCGIGMGVVHRLYTWLYNTVVQPVLSVNGQPTSWHNMLHSVNTTTNWLLQPVAKCKCCLKELAAVSPKVSPQRPHLTWPNSGNIRPVKK